MTSHIKIDKATNENDNPYHYPFRIFDATPPEYDLPTLQQLAVGAKQDKEIDEKVTAWHHSHADALARAWRETDPARVKAFWPWPSSITAIPVNTPAWVCPPL